MLFTKTELWKTCLCFYYPNLARISFVIKRATYKFFSPLVVVNLEKIEDVCDVCQFETDGPHGFCLSLPYEYCVFIHIRLFSTDLTKLKRRIVFCLVDREWKLSVKDFLLEAGLCRARSISISLGVPVCRMLRVWLNETGAPIPQKTARNLFQRWGTMSHLSGVKFHNAFGDEGQYHVFLKQSYNKTD